MDAIEPPDWLADIPDDINRQARQAGEFTLTDIMRELNCLPAYARRLSMDMVERGLWARRTNGMERGRRCNFYWRLTGAAGTKDKGPMRSDANATDASRPPRRKGKR